MAKMSLKERSAFVQGVYFAAEIADTYNSSTTHAYCLGDCIKAKMNLIPKGEIRRNKNRLKRPSPKKRRKHG